MKRMTLTLLAAAALFAASPAPAEIRKITIEPKEGGWHFGLEVILLKLCGSRVQ